MLNPIRKARLLAGLSQGDLAREMGLSQGAVSLWERGKTSPSAPKLKRLAVLLNTTVDELLKEVS